MEFDIGLMLNLEMSFLFVDIMRINEMIWLWKVKFNSIYFGSYLVISVIFEFILCVGMNL